MWTLRLNDVPQQDTHCVVSINGRVYSFCTYPAAGRHDLNSPVDVVIVDPATYRWDFGQRQSHPDSEPYAIYRRNAVAHGHCAYLLLPHQCSIPRSVLHRFDTSTLTWSRPEGSGEGPTPEFGHTACVVGNRMYIFCDVDGRNLFLDLASMEWHRVVASGEAPLTHSIHFALAIGTCVYVCVRSLKNHFSVDNLYGSNVLYYLETTTHTWVRPQAKGFPGVDRVGFSGFVHNGKLYILGGCSLLLETHWADLHKYDPKTSCWTEVKPSGLGPSARLGHGCSTTGERVFVFGGRGPVRHPVTGEVADWNSALTDLHVLHLAPTLQNLCLLAVIDARLDVSGWPPIFKKAINAITSHCS